MRSMADAIGANWLDAINANTDIVAVYVTGIAPVPWSPAQIDAIPAGKSVVTIDQASGNAPQHSATVQDVEPNCYSPADVPAWQAQCTAERPTVYCDRSDLPAILATGWTGNLWLAIPGWMPGSPLPSAPGCAIVAVQNQFDVNGTHDLSVVLDSTWPHKEVNTLGDIASDNGFQVCSKCFCLYPSGNAAQSVCPAGGQHSTPAGWHRYALQFTD